MLGDPVVFCFAFSAMLSSRKRLISSPASSAMNINQCVMFLCARARVRVYFMYFFPFFCFLPERLMLGVHLVDFFLPLLLLFAIKE